MRKTVFLLAAFFFLITVTAYSQPVNKFAKKGQWEIGGTIGFVSTTPVTNGNTDDSWSIFNFSPSVSYFVTDGFEIGGMIDFQSIKPSGGSSTTIYTLYAVPTYNINTDSYFYPYLQAQLGYNGYSNGESRSGIAWSLGGGVKANFVTNGLLKFGINYTQQTLNKSGDTERDGFNIFSVVLGAGVFF